MEAATENETVDSILGGRLKLVQPRRGYRFSVEAVLLGSFARAANRDRVLELGAGCGVISIVIAALFKPRQVAAIEIQPALAQLIARNAALNGLPMVAARFADLRERKIEGITPAGFDLVVANPPYRARETGRESPDEGRRLARGESAGTLQDFVAAAARYARHGGRTAFVFSAERSAELIALLRSHSLEPKRIRFVHPRAAKPASAVLIEARKGAGVEVVVEPPLIIYSRKGAYTKDARRLLFTQGAGTQSPSGRSGRASPLL
jgi:tRNA1(Val) A37 N6-methylase TrmN6